MSKMDINLKFNGFVGFHGGCIGCTQQQIHGYEFCCGCFWFEPAKNKPDLNNKCEDEATKLKRYLKANVCGKP